MIRWITDKLGTASYYDYEEIRSTIDAVVIDVRELTDREGNTAGFVMAKIQAALKALRDERNVVVCCDKGISRSNAIVAGVLMASGMSYEDVVGLLVEKVAVSDMNLGLLHDIRSLFGDAQEQDQKAAANILVTGSTGFVGRALVDALRSEYNVFCPHRGELDLTRDLHLLDLYVKKNNIGFIMHLAHPRMRNSVSAMAEAVAMMRNILEVCRLDELGVLYLSGLVVFSGYISDSVLEARSSLEPWPRGTYAETKFLCEELIGLYQKNYGLKATVLRPAALYGRGMDRATFICKFFEAAMQGATIRTHRYRNGPPIFDFLYLDDLIDVIRLALHIRPRVTLNIGTGKGTSTYEIAQAISRISSSGSAVEMIDIDDETYKVIVDPSEARAYLGWEAKTDLETGIKELWEWFSRSVSRYVTWPVEGSYE